MRLEERIHELFTKWLEFDAKLRVWHKDIKNIHYRAILWVVYVIVNALLIVSFIGVSTFLLVTPFLLLPQTLLMVGLSSATAETVVHVVLGFAVVYLIALGRNMR